MIGGLILQAAIVAAAYLIGRYNVVWKLAMYVRAKWCSHIHQVPLGTTGDNVCLLCKRVLHPGDKDYQDFGDYQIEV